MVAAVSGGADSVAMLRTLHEIRQGNQGSGELLVAHVNHGIRGARSDQDAAWVCGLAESLGLQCEIATITPPGTGESHRGLCRHPLGASQEDWPAVCRPREGCPRDSAS